VIDPNALVTENVCRRGSKSEFAISGRGGLPPSLREDLNSEATQVGLVEPAPMDPGEATSREISAHQGSSASVSTAIVPAQGWVFNEKGEVVLVAYDPTVTGPQRLREKGENCDRP
jgi:large exoprotein involved in heme utilization and adhesion